MRTQFLDVQLQMMKQLLVVQLQVHPIVDLIVFQRNVVLEKLI